MKHFFFLLLCFGWKGVVGQQVPQDSTNQQNKVDVSAIAPQSTPKSPHATALSRYGEYPVSLYNGLPSIEIPIYEFSVGTTRVPIKLTYHASGNKVADRACWVGLGWSL